MLQKSDGGSGRRGSPPARNSRPPGRGSAGGAHVRQVQRSHSSGQRRQRYRPHRHPAGNLCCKGLWRHRIAGDQRGRNFRIFCIWVPRFFSGDCSMVKGMKGQHGVGLAIKEEIVKKPGEDGIKIECISALS